MQVEAIMSAEPVTVTRASSLDEALAKLDRTGYRHLPVVDGERVVGLLSDRDLLAATGWLPARIHATRGPQVSDALPRTVGEVMCDEVVTVGRTDDVDAIGAFLVGRAIGCVPVVENELLVGIVTESDLLSAYSRGAWGLRGGAPSVADAMTRSLETISWDTPLGEAVARCQERSLRHLLVVEGGQLVGVLSDRDLRRAQGRGGKDTTRIDSYVAHRVVHVPSSRPLTEAAELLVKHRIGALPVLDEDELVGILTVTDILMKALEASGEASA